MYILRRAATMRVKKALGVAPQDGCREFYCCSLSSRTIVYKGQLTPEQARLSSSSCHFQPFTSIDLLTLYFWGRYPSAPVPAA